MTLSAKRGSVLAARVSLPILEEEIAAYERPRRRSDCMTAEQLARDPDWVADHPGEQPVDGPNAARPCPWARCKYHLFSDVRKNLKLNFPHVDPDELGELKDTCVLDVADEGGIVLEEVGERLNVTRERARQLEERGLKKLKEGLPFDLRIMLKTEGVGP